MLPSWPDEAPGRATGDLGRMRYPETLRRKTRVPIIRVSMWAGRTREQKAALARELTDVMVRVGKTTAEATTIIFEEVEKSDWASGGMLESDKR